MLKLYLSGLYAIIFIYLGLKYVQVFRYWNKGRIGPSFTSEIAIL